MIVKICRIFDKKDGTLHIGSVVWRFLLFFMWLVLSWNIGVLIAKAIIRYNLVYDLIWVIKLFIWA